ncbi:PREDICTED: uncharacterized protein LOC108364161 isoform X3 [Rhagoletis zephyria]|uniref:uncharacterized protein LOC108364161 isoform X3 n=1 Tax=Rhagoletis zephyria TaxID=28612 RepID=UPI0008119F24|nr:PREDICTED: uncharacterized protein LOC108364161 isoform X3 [Rhagoletis zephyria]XP_017473473.1 PREDICTED: uncharacterized protein LOC108364161 isoform X3 [Rhagoletis zephyria]
MQMRTALEVGIFIATEQRFNQIFLKMLSCGTKFFEMMANIVLQSRNDSRESQSNSDGNCNSRMADNELLQPPNSLPLENNNTSLTLQRVDRQTSTMTSPSTNSSEVEALSSHHALDVVKGYFIKDFDLRDVQMYIRDIFNEYEKRYIEAGVYQDEQSCQHEIQDAHREEQVLRLFAVLRHKDPSQITKFMDALLLDYSWLVNHFENVNKVDYSRYVDLVHSLHSKVHLKFDDYNVHRSVPFRKLRNALLDMPPAGRVVLVSDFGCGKKWLAIDACSDFDVANAMNFQIHWVDMSQCTSSLEDLRMLRYLKLLLTQSTRSPSPASYGSLDRVNNNTQVYKNSIAEVCVELKKHLDKKCLVILVNVQNTHALKAFDLPCKLLVITRSKKVSDSFAKKRSTTLNVNRGFTREELYLLFEKYLEHQNFKESHVDLIYAHSNGHPYLLSLIAQSLRQNLNNWQSWIDKLRESDLVDEKFNAAIEKSLESLEPDLRKAFSEVFRCFPHAIFVPKRVIVALWPGSSCEKDLIKLHRHGFLEKCILETGDFFKLPFIYGKMKERYVVTDEEIVDMHKKLLEYYHFVEDLDARKEVLPFQRDVHDFYFFLCIGYHLKKSGLTHYFRQIYLDYGFLEQKMRNVDLLSTIADLETFRHYIAPNSERRKAFRAIREFLPNIEKTLQESKNATLLQCALMESGLVGDEARTQAAAFPDYTWFEHRGFFHQRHNIISLPSTPKKVILLDHERSLIVLEESKTILLVNTSLNWNSYSVKLKDPVLVKTTVVDALFFTDNNYDIVLALYSNGDMKFWCIPCDCSTDRRRSDSFARPQAKEIECCNVTPRAYLFKPITAFELSYEGNDKQPYLYMAHMNGEISNIQWKSESKTFCSTSTPFLKTEMRAITIVRLIFRRFYVVGNTKGEVRIFDVTDYSQQRGLEPFTNFIEAIELSRNETLLVCNTCIVRFTSSSILQTGHVEYLLHQDDLTAYDQGNVIKCAKLLFINGRKQLVLGTNSGLIIFDIEMRTRVLTTNVNEQITCVDVHPLENAKYKYMVACGSHERKLLNLFALRVDDSGGTLLGWSHRATVSRLGERDRYSDAIDFHMAPDAWLKGGKLFAVQYEYDEATILAVDSQNQIHKIDNDGHKVFPRLPHTITALTQSGKQAIVGCVNGMLFDLTTSTPLFTSAFKNQPIEFLQLLDEYTLVAGSNNELVIFTDLSTGQQKPFILKYGKIKRCFRLAAGRILIVFVSCVFWVLDESACLINKYEPMRSIGDCDLQNNQLFVVTENYRIEIFDLAESLGPKQPKIIHFGTMSASSKTKVSCVAVSRDASLVAIACYEDDGNGEIDVRIEVYECRLAAKCIEFLYYLRGHHCPIFDMRFSPNAHVLVSCAEQMCWWSMQMAACKLNNALEVRESSRQKKNNSRFSSADTDSSTTDSETDETVDASVVRTVPTSIFEEVSMLPHKDTRSPADVTPVDGVCGEVATDAVWTAKRGPIAHRELLSCIKFNGSEAQQFFANESFTQFQTIDNGGGYYVLTLRDFSNPKQASLPSPLHKNFPVTVAYKAELSIDEREYGEGGGVDVVT